MDTGFIHSIRTTQFIERGVTVLSKLYDLEESRFGLSQAQNFPRSMNGNSINLYF